MRTKEKMKKYFSKVTRNKMKAFVCLMLSFLLVFPYISQIVMESVKAETLETATSMETSRTYEHDGYAITYNVKASWTGHQVIEVTLKNTGDSAISNWMVSVDNGSDKSGTNTAGSGENTSENSTVISGLWNAIQTSEDESENILIKSQTYNNTIKSGESVTFGYTLSGENLEFPQDIYLCMSETVKKDGVRLEYQTTGDWGSQFQGELKLINENNQAISGWKLRIKGNFNIDNIWNCELTADENGTYIITHTTWENTIPAGAEYTIGFVGSKSEEEMTIENWELTVTDKDDLVSDESESESESEPESESQSEKPSESEKESESEFRTETQNPSEQESTAETESAGETESTSEQESSSQKETESENTTEAPVEPDWSDATDTDEDGLPDVYENHMFGTNHKNADTDGDKLPDGYEIMNSGTDPVKADSDENGITDDMEDADGDVLNTYEEYTLGTEPQSADTDYDGLSDYEEKNTHGTNPVKADTDEDGISDGDEIKLGLDPLNPATHGVPDSKYTVEQTILTDSRIFEDINTDTDIPYTFSVDVKAAGVAEENLHLYNEENVFQNEAYIGRAVRLEYNDSMMLETMQVNFMPDESIIENELNLFDDTEELKGIKRLNVFWFDEDINMLLPIETFHDTENNIVSAITDKDGVYCLVDMEKWFVGLEENLGEELIMEQTEEVSTFGLRQSEAAVMSLADDETVLTEAADSVVNENLTKNTDESENENQEDDIIEAEDVIQNVASTNISEETFASFYQMMNMPMTLAADDEETDTRDDRPIDIVYVLQTEGNSEYQLDNNPLVPWVWTAFLEEDFSNMRVCILEIRKDGVYCNGVRNSIYWYDDMDEVKDYLYYELDLSDPDYIPDVVDRTPSFEMLLSEQMDFRKDSSKFVVEIPSGTMRVSNLVFADAMEKMIEKGINYSEFHIWFEPYGNYTGTMERLINSTGGQLFSIAKQQQGLQKDFDDHVRKYMENHVAPQTEFNAIVATGYEKITLKAPLSSTSGTDTESDGRTDWAETNTDLLVWNADGSITLPSLLYCVENYSDDSYVIKGLDRFKAENTASGMPSDLWENYIEKLMSKTYILPIHSNPVKADSDGDGIKDIFDRYNDETMDIRYESLMPLKSNTIETLYPELELKDSNKKNNKNNAVYFDIDGNNIEMYVRTQFEGDYNEKFTAGGITLDRTYKDVAIDGIKLWSGEYEGAYCGEEKVHYDFVDGMTIYVNVNVFDYDVNTMKGCRYVTINIDNSDYEDNLWSELKRHLINYGISNTYIKNWKPSTVGTGLFEMVGRVTMYKAYINDSVYPFDKYESAMSHEFGHVLGIYDAYSEANGGIVLDGNKEVVIDKDNYKNTTIMYTVGGKIYVNEVEMFLEAFSTEKQQWYIKASDNNVSNVIRLKQTYGE